MAGKPAKSRMKGGDGSDEELDRAIDGLRGVLRKDADGGTSADDLESISDMMSADPGQNKAFAADFGSDFDAEESDFDAGAAGDEFGAGFPAAPADFEEEPAAALFAPEKPGPARRASDAAPRRAEVGDIAQSANYDLVMDIPIDMQIVLGNSRLPVAGLMNLAEGSLIALDRRIGEPVDILVNGRHFGRGEITVLDGEDTRFGVRLIEVMTETTKK